MATIRLKNSVVASKAPAAGDLVLGEVALNANSTSPALYFKDNTDNIVKIEPGSGVVPSPTPPSSPSEGDLWYNETTNSLNYWNGAAWIELGQAGDSPVTSVNGDVGAVVLGAADVGALAAGDNISELTNNTGFITAAEAPVTSVNGDIGVVVLDAAAVGALSDDTPLDYVPLGSWAAIPPLPPAAPGRSPILIRN